MLTQRRPVNPLICHLAKGHSATVSTSLRASPAAAGYASGAIGAGASSPALTLFFRQFADDPYGRSLIIFIEAAEDFQEISLSAAG
jgi:hypothetical protein